MSIQPSLESIVALAREIGVSKEAVARAWVEVDRKPVAVIVSRAGMVERQYRDEAFP